MVWYLCSYWWITMHDFTSLTKINANYENMVATDCNLQLHCKIGSVPRIGKCHQRIGKHFQSSRTFIAKSSPASVNYFIISHSQNSPQTTQRGILSSTNNFKQGHFSPAIKNTSTVTPSKLAACPCVLLSPDTFSWGE